jgi:chorismate mutase
MSLQAVMDSLDGVDENVAKLYTERNGKFELTGITGIKTQGDIDRLTAAAAKERDEHRATKDKLALWGDRDPAATLADLDKIAEYKIAADGKLDEGKMEELVAARLKTATGPLDRQVATLTQERDAAVEENVALKAEKNQRTIHDAVRAALVKENVLQTAHDDALMLSDRMFEITDDGKVVTKGDVGVTPGVDAEVWLKDMAEKRPHWWAPSEGGGGKPGSSGPGGTKNPWSKSHWNLTEQGRVIREEGREKADALAKQAGSYVGATAPAEK